MRFPHQRLAQLFTLLQNETLPQEELAQRLSVLLARYARTSPR